MDQKGVHLNEGESKNLGTAALKGKPVAVKTNHAQSRARSSLCNRMSNDPQFQPPVEICFKLKTGRCLKDLKRPEGVLMYFTHSASGSYDLACFVNYLRRVLPEWTPERERTRDYRPHGSSLSLG